MQPNLENIALGQDLANDGSSNPDAGMVAKACAGDMNAFEYLVRRYRNEVYALCYHFTRSREDAWDLAQDTFVKAYRSLVSFRGEAGFKTWLMRIAANGCKDHLKKRRLETVPFDDTRETEESPIFAGPDRNVENRELAEAIDAAVQSLPAKHRLAFLLREYEGMSYQEMAAVMGCNVGTVMSRLFHARRKLQEILRGTGLAEGR